MVNVWLVDLQSGLPSEIEAACWRLLAPDEQQRASAFRSASGRAQFVVGRALARLALSRNCRESDPRRWKFDYLSGGKPVVANGPAFNVTHTSSAVVCAVSDEMAVGADIETIERPFDVQLYSKVLTPPEMSRISTLQPPESGEEFARIWTVKEAAAKANGLGLSVDFSRIDLRPSAGGYAVSGAAGEWFVWQEKVSSSHYLAVAMRMEQTPVLHHLTSGQFANAVFTASL